MTAIGFVGLGAMGGRIAGRLLRGNQLYGTNRSPSKASDLIAPILGPLKCSSLIERIFQLDNVRSIRDLRPLLQRG